MPVFSFFNIHTSHFSLLHCCASTFFPADETFFFNPNVDNQLYKQIPATSVAVAASTNTIASIVLAWSAFGKPLRATQLAGLGVCLGGAAAYSRVGLSKKGKSKRYG